MSTPAVRHAAGQRTWRRVAACSFAVGVVLFAGCESADKAPGGSARWTSPSSGPIKASSADGAGAQQAFGLHPFDPVSMRVHPLTHVQAASDVSGTTKTDGAAAEGMGGRINCFVEFKDRWGDTCKALGTLQVQLYRPAPEAGQEKQDAKWDADLTDLAKNADWFDPVTRAYRLQLQLPEWLGDPSKNGKIKLRVVYTPSSADGEGRKLRDEFVVSRS